MLLLSRFNYGYFSVIISEAKSFKFGVESNQTFKEGVPSTGQLAHNKANLLVFAKQKESFGSGFEPLAPHINLLRKIDYLLNGDAYFS